MLNWFKKKTADIAAESAKIADTEKVETSAAQAVPPPPTGLILTDDTAAEPEKDSGAAQPPAADASAGQETKEQTAAESKAAAPSSKKPAEPLKGNPKVIYKKLLACMYDAVIITDPSGHIIETNDRVNDLFGFKTDALWDVSVTKLIRGITPQLLDKLRTNIADNRRILLEANCTRADKATFPAEVAICGISLIHDGDFVFVVRNTQKRQDAMNKMRSYVNAVDKSPLPVIIVDAEGTVTYANNMVLAMTGLAKDAFLHKPLSDFFTEKEKAASLMSAIKAGRRQVADLTMPCAGGKMFDARLTLEPDCVVKGKVNGAIVYISGR